VPADSGGTSGPGQPPPGQQPWSPPSQPWAPPPKRRRSRWLTVGLPIGALLLLAGVGTLAVILIKTIAGSLGPAKDAAEAYATALVEERWDDAHSMLCEQSRSEVTSEDLASLHGGLSDYSLTGINVHSSGGRTTGEATITFERDDGLDDTTAVPLVEESGDWRPCP
jgi:hypothetical protein